MLKAVKAAVAQLLDITLLCEMYHKKCNGRAAQVDKCAVMSCMAMTSGPVYEEWYTLSAREVHVLYLPSVCEWEGIFVSCVTFPLLLSLESATFPACFLSVNCSFWSLCYDWHSLFDGHLTGVSFQCWKQFPVFVSPLLAITNKRNREWYEMFLSYCLHLVGWDIASSSACSPVV